MNQTTIEVLEFDKIKERLTEFAVSQIGKKMALEMEPSADIRVIENNMLETTEAKLLIKGSSSVPLHHLSGIPDILEKTGKGYVLEPEELSLLAGFLRDGKKMKRFMKDREYTAPVVSSYARSITEFEDINEEIEHCIRNGLVEDQASPELARIRKKIFAAEERIKSKLNSIMRSAVMRTYLQENLVSMRGDRYVIPVKSEYRKNVRGNILDFSASGSTVFIEPEEIRALYDELKLARVLEEEEVFRILSNLTALVAAAQREVSINVEVMAQYDFAFAKAKYSRALDANPVKLNTKGRIMLYGAKHPLIGTAAVPLDLILGILYRAFVITGPNTGGKTVALKTTGLLTMMAQCGLHVPAGEGSELAVFTDILADIGDGQSIQQSLSSFSAHIRNIKTILECAKSNTLVLLDELGAGTDPKEGMGLAISILEHIYEKGAVIMATTHFSEIKDFARDRKGFENGCMEFDVDTLKPLFKLKIGAPGQSNAFLIALRLGVAPNIIERAHEITYQEKKTYQVSNMGPISGNRIKHSAEKKETAPEAKITERPKSEKPQNSRAFGIGDSVLIKSLGKTAIICEPENNRGEVCVMYQKKKMRINKKRLELHIKAEDLYPEDYDMDIIFETKENRKKRHLMSRKHQEGVIIKSEPNE